MPILRFEGYCDDTFGEWETFQVDHDNCARGKPIEYLVALRNSGTRSGVIVTGIYGFGRSPGWSIMVSNWDPDREDAPMPDWPMRFQRAGGGDDFSPALVIEAPDGVTLDLLTDEEDEE